MNHKGRNRHFTDVEELEQERKKAEQKKWRKKQGEEDEEESSSEEEASEKSEDNGMNFYFLHNSYIHDLIVFRI